ncbi:Histone-like bacterial DNA-binding protein [gut metagenome]|uniref:Histone-like bacterial DNA-binding protein n=1 Tax=gut metagenome TaxID=749906 RepID=J9FVI4_9ZZZZ
MNNKDYINSMAARLDISPSEVQRLTQLFVNEIAESMDDNSSLAIPGFGSFEVVKKMERIVVNPSSRQRMLVPPKLVLSFKASANLKEKLNS